MLNTNEIFKLFKLESLKPKMKRLMIVLNSHWVSGVLISLVSGLIILLLTLYFSGSASFVVSNQKIKFTDPIIIKAGNSKADRPDQCLNVIYDGKLFEKQAIPHEKKERQIWHFMIKNQDYSPEMIKPGTHKIKVGFPGDDAFSEEFSIVLIKQPPKFIILNPTLRSDAIMKIKADNSDANVKKLLHVEFDSVLFPECGLPVDSNGLQIWHCNLKKLQLTKKMKENGKHTIRLRFPGEDLSKKHTIILLTQGIVVNTELKRQNNVNIFRGKTAGKAQIEDNTFQVDVIFYHEGPDNEISVPIQRKK